MFNFTSLLKRTFMTFQTINESYSENSFTSWEIYLSPQSCLHCPNIYQAHNMCQALWQAVYNVLEVEVSSETAVEMSQNLLYSLIIIYPPSIQPRLTEYLPCIRHCMRHQGYNKRLRPALRKFSVYQGKQLSLEREHSCWGTSSGPSSGPAQVQPELLIRKKASCQHASNKSRNRTTFTLSSVYLITLIYFFKISKNHCLIFTLFYQFAIQRPHISFNVPSVKGEDCYILSY